MLDREKIVAVLKKRFAGAGADQIAAATNAIIGLEDEWEELSPAEAPPCSDSCYLARATAEEGTRFRVLKRRVND
jgi:hypothetical protein